MQRKKKNFECISLLCLLEKQKVAEAAQGICTTYGKNVFYILKDGYFDTDNLQHSEKLPGFDKNFLNFIIHSVEAESEDLHRPGYGSRPVPGTAT